MKIGKRLLILMTVVAFTPAIQTMAQYRPTGTDGITASPKLRQQLDARAAENRPVTAAPAVAAKPAAAESRIAASPKAMQALTAHKTASSAVTSTAVASTTAAPSDGIAASPKLRDQMSAHGPAVQIAPIK
jgi:hypothetical protein